VTSFRLATLESVHCSSTTSLTTREAARLRVVSGAVPATSAPLHCEIVARHDGNHLALAAVSEDDQLWWWLRWGDQARDVHQIDLCDGRDLDDPYLDECLLPKGHPGPHSYESPTG
jgi:hypothetical protein